MGGPYNIRTNRIMATKFNFISGKARWASVIKPNTTYEPCWSIDVILDEGNKAKVEGLGLITKYKEDVGDYIQIKRKVTTKKGDTRDAPDVVDSKRNVWGNSLIGNGSEVNVKFHTFNWNHNNKSGIGADLDAVQVVKLVEYGADFDDIDDGYVIGDDGSSKSEWEDQQGKNDEVPF